MSRILGVDPGEARVGLAVSDPLGLTAQPLEVIARSQTVERVTELVRDLGVEALVVGLPVSLSGLEGQQAAAARSLAEELGAATGLPVHLVDERFTTRMAGEPLKGQGATTRRRSIDKLAAAVILQSFLDRSR